MYLSNYHFYNPKNYLYSKPVKGLQGFRVCYCFGFNGKERDNETYGEGNAYDFGARIYDSRLGRWLSLDPLTSKYPNLSPYLFAGNNPILFVDFDGNDFGINANHTDKTIFIKATYYTSAGNSARVNNALKGWNNTSGKYYYRTGNRKTGYQFYKINFELSSKESPDPLDDGRADNAGNSFTVQPDDAIFFQRNPNRGAFTSDNEEIGVRESRKDETLSQTHEVGHTLIGGEGHTLGTVMNPSIEGDGGENPGILNIIDKSVVSDVLGTAGIGKKSDILNNQSSTIGIEKGEGFKTLDPGGKVISEKKMMRQMARQEKRENRKKNK
jgi:RHS repeat-associated protein